MKKYFFLFFCAFFCSRLFAADSRDRSTSQEILPYNNPSIFASVFNSHDGIQFPPPTPTTLAEQPPSPNRRISTIENYGHVHRLQHGGDDTTILRSLSQSSYPMHRPGREWNDPNSQRESEEKPASIPAHKESSQSNHSSHSSSQQSFSDRQFIPPIQHAISEQPFRSIRRMMYFSLALHVTSTTLLLYHISTHKL